MKLDIATRYQIMLEIMNAVVAKTSDQEFFNALAYEIKKHLPCDRLSINIYEEEGQSLRYFTIADGINPEGISSLDRRPLQKGSIAKMAIESKKPIIIEDLKSYKGLFSIGQMVKAGLTSTMAFPLIIRDTVLGTLHFSFRSTPAHLSALTELLTEISKQVAIAVDNLLAYNRLKNEKQNLEKEKHYLLEVADQYKSENFYSVSSEMKGVLELATRVADIDAAVFITGETGTGKDFLARTIPQLSSRSEHMFVKVNCPAIPETLFESELFGHAKGAFTGADSQRIGRFEMADKGTIFLDEVGELPAGLQAKLLQVLQERRFERVGDTRSIEVDFRIIAATNRDPEQSIQLGKLRKDLYYRLNIIRIHIPPLRERKDDIPFLVEQITNNVSQSLNQPPPYYSQQILDQLESYHWPGNVRELKNFVKRMIILYPDRQITANHIENMTMPSEEAPNADTTGKLTTLGDAERKHIIQALKQCRGVVGGGNGAARLLNIPRSTLQYRMKKHGITVNKLGSL